GMSVLRRISTGAGGGNGEEPAGVPRTLDEFPWDESLDGNIGKPTALPSLGAMPLGSLIEDEVTGRIIAGAIEVHRDKGPGLNEGIYEWCLMRRT
ncbi:MAG TPA: GxxExxY protein, partial [Opitutaceae bacterium]|nr:GxxExxY protein [Opitutaceae bacterium]